MTHLNSSGENITYVIMPNAHLQVILKQYLYQVGVLAEEQRIHQLFVPVEIDDEDNITLKIQLEGTLN